MCGHGFPVLVFLKDLDDVRPADLRAAAKADPVAGSSDWDFVSPMPPDRVQPLDRPDFLRKEGIDEVFAA
jgi:hypothetical protein